MLQGVDELVVHAGSYGSKGECASVYDGDRRTLELVVAVLHQCLEDLVGVRGRSRVVVGGPYHECPVLLMVVAMLDLLSDGPRGFGGSVVGAISGG